MPRVDQRRWAEVYLRGLLFLDGRKSVRKMAESILSLPVSQSLQQFINQSPWDWTPIRSQLAHFLGSQMENQAWVVSPAVIPKRGSHSVGVVRQFIPKEGRMINCQLGLGLFMTNATTIAPVNWRLLLKGKWAHDEDARAKVYLPDSVRGRPEWREILSMVDQSIGRWQLPPAPIVAHVPDPVAARELVDALDVRGLNYVLRVSESFRDLVQDQFVRSQRSKVLVGGEGARESGRLPPLLGTLEFPVGHQSTSVLIPLAGPRGKASYGNRVIRLIRERRRHSPGTQKLWITNMTQARLDDVMYVASLADRSTQAVRLLESNFGLQDFEGRSFRGWHHHITMVSAAWTYQQVYGGLE
ncbi:transposase [Streptomyces sp. 8K308]|uniref:IS701 family transposase n=1 Tax=Streptomyces sp. 8K308 TaxID=2530388 RepID=UPI001FB79631|nr:transposase [Streptomyces sp. 8K308]